MNPSLASALAVSIPYWTGCAFLLTALGCLWFRLVFAEWKDRPAEWLAICAAVACLAFAGAFWFGGLP